ncbi:unnamed protein product [Rotaria sp. Silwood2]|nr:unnamed protein product [Rotaria sp. Silwood2]CAF2709430.1 unnamed protein product [Rotaria sp. Silwood2]CAF3115034.1 unnamed protein product [Rotaria sp. Silwood2]CAF4255965.1 unnamed protein product [Rotaria sp. Silwood2]CAF4471630.1 unnamed protein product [Rotaria sp. Silwood2]
MVIGDFAIIELFATKYPATKKQENRARETALQIAEKQEFKRIAQVLKFGPNSASSLITAGKKDATPKHSYEVLAVACQNGQAKIIKEFCQERYESREEKRHLCYELIPIAKKHNQEEIANILQFHYDEQLKMDIPSDIELDKIVTLGVNYKKMLHGLLDGLSTLITGTSVDLDPTDPNTFVDLFSKLTSKARQNSTDLVNANTTESIRTLIKKDESDLNKKMNEVENRLNELEMYNKTLEDNIRETDKRLSSAQGLPATERKKIFEERELHKKQLAVYESSILVFRREQETLSNRTKTIQYIKQNPNLFLFYRTIENRLQALFTSVLAAQGGYLKTQRNTTYNILGTASDAVFTVLNMEKESIGQLLTFRE